jgi:hypothetical protein
LPLKARRVPPRARAFFERVPHLFAASQRGWEKAYNELLYRVERPLTAANVRDIRAWAGGRPTLPSGKELALLNSVLLPVRWPDVRGLARLRAIPGLSLPEATALLHFHSPSFPPFTAEAVEGYARVGRRMKRPASLGLEQVRAYRAWMDAVAELKEAIPFPFVPESHYFHVWVLECALAELARGGNGHRAGKR